MKATGRKAGAQTTYYMTRISERHRSNVNYADLPLRDHEQIAAMASRIEHGVDEDERKELQTNSGINGKRTYKTGQTLGSDKAKHQDAFVIPKGAWATIAKEISRSNHTTPAQTAPRVGNITKKSFWTAETYSYFLMFLGPVVLKGRLPAPYYAHFILLSGIAKRVTSQEISLQELPVLHRKIVVWVKAFEK
ncbi:hypothetical protein QFC21_001840 [Naganishia friedmannii]|uniref:Uncharacterized protein n=1 Tax=Naganishia friedmannii TaxID=89922 RepID=A0ACC2W2E0_9TREE|nr:hypothetical protein QFC21_001840 [Naganishia friedmannii]